MAQVYKFHCNNCGVMMKMALAPANPSLPMNTAIQILCAKCNTIVFSNVTAQQPKPNANLNSQNHPTNSNKSTGRHMPLAASFDNINVTPKYEKIKGRYQIINKIGSGTMGQVYLAYDEKDKVQVAIKMLAYENKNENVKKSAKEKEKEKKSKDFFIREATVLMQLQHPNIIAFKGGGNHDGNLFIVMEYTDGRNLLEHIQQKRQILPRHAAHLMVCVLNGLKYAHEEHNIIHRDIKPANIYINSKKEVKLIDLGLGKIVDESVELTKTGEIMGTCSYMPLEQIQKTKDAGRTADIYAVGATLYHALAGIAPFEEYSKNLAQLFTAKIQDRYKRLKEVQPNLPDEIIRIVEKAMAKMPADRYQTAEEMRKDLQQFEVDQRKLRS